MPWPKKFATMTKLFQIQPQPSILQHKSEVLVLYTARRKIKLTRKLQQTRLKNLLAYWLHNYFLVKWLSNEYYNFSIIPQSLKHCIKTSYLRRFVLASFYWLFFPPFLFSGSTRKWYFVTIIILTYCEKKLF